ncbi:MAG: alpha-L-arabinofuranosidase C-terminal domain-containing protein [Isosphaeraceae bacterium]
MKFPFAGVAVSLLGLLASRDGGVPAQAAPADPHSATVTIRLDRPTAPVPPTLYGIFMEEISHAFDGGLYAELIQNRSFEEGVLPAGMKLVKKEDGSLKMELESLPDGVPRDRWEMPWPWNGNCGWDPDRALVGWSLRNEGGASGAMKLTEAHPMNAASSRSLELTVSTPAAEGRVALINSGYWGVAVREDTTYGLTLSLRPGTFRGSVTALLESKDGRVLARHEFGEVEPGGEWRRLTAQLAASGTDPSAQFVLSFRGEGTLQVDWVSLFPPTFKGRPNGLRPDLAQYLADLKPSFIRYPGGCYVEGLSWQSAPDWRTMVCPPEERPGTWGYWKYRSTDGFGYHEFLQFCEDVGADAMFVSFAGMTVHPDNNVPLDRIGPIIQQTLDAIEYALGPVTSTWGARRAAMGHPEPFPLKYVEIGNEHPPAVYGDYYRRFRDAIKAKYPSMTVIMSMFWSGLNDGAIARAGDANIDVVDEHAYRDANWIRTHSDHFDGYARRPWKVYVGEYASHHRGGDWAAALGDSVYLMMLERNGDLVTMASYAPLFCNVHARDWGVNLIEYDASRSFAHASYYVQKMFRENRPDVGLKVAAEVAPGPDPTRPLMAGRIGLGAWNTRTEFKELRVFDERGTLVLEDDFASLDRWEAPGVGRWDVHQGILRQTDERQTPAMLLLKSPPLTTGRVTLKARRVGGSEGFLIFFNAGGIDRFLFGNFGAAGNTFSAIQDRGAPEGCAFEGGQSTPGKIEDGRWYEISLVVGRDHAGLFLDGRKVSDARVVPLPEFSASAGLDRTGRAVVVKATNYRREPLGTEIVLEGAGDVEATGRHLFLTADHPDDENTLEQPRRIVPRERPLEGCSRRFRVSLPASSVNVLRIPLKD